MAKAENLSPSTPPQGETKETATQKKSIGSTLMGLFVKQREASIFLIAIILCIVFQIANSNFMTIGNARTIAEYSAETVIIAVGEVMLLICGEIDLSTGFTYALAPFIMFNVYNAGYPLFLGIIAALVVSALIGLFNGAVTVFFKVPSFIATLGAYFFLNGITLTISNAYPDVTPDTGAFWNGVLGNNIYWESFWALLFVVIMQFVLSYTRWGLHTIASGSNAVGSGEVGINVKSIKLRNFMLASLLAGFAGILLAFRVTSIDPTAGGAEIMFEAVAGAVIGGTALQGGSGTIVGAFLGTLVLQILKDGLVLMGINAFTFDIILGLAIVIAMVLNIRLQQLRKASR